MEDIVAMTRHTLTPIRGEIKYAITFDYAAGRPAVMYLRNGDPGYPADPPEIEFVSVHPPGNEHWAREWLTEDGLEEALEVVYNDQEYARDQAAEGKRER